MTTTVPAGSYVVHGRAQTYNDTGNTIQNTQCVLDSDHGGLSDRGYGGTLPHNAAATIAVAGSFMTTEETVITLRGAGYPGVYNDLVLDAVQVAELR